MNNATATAMNTANKSLATIAEMAANGATNMAAITHLLGTVYAVENINFAGIHTKQALQAAGLTNEAMILDAALCAQFDNSGFALSAEMQAQGLAWLRKLAKRKDSPMSWRENEALKDGAVIRWVNLHAEYNPKNGENTHYLPVFDVDNAETGEHFQYYAKNGKVEICG